MTRPDDSKLVRRKLQVAYPFVTLLVLFLAGIPDIGFCKTLTRSCKGAEMIQYEVNGKKEGVEECDDGVNNSDTISDACRSNCTRAHCGDYTIDSGEECDDGTGNSNKIPGACRTNCKRAYCGDCVLDVSEGEICDDGNTDPYDGCHQCQECKPAKDNLTITRDTRLCGGRFSIRDSGRDGAIRVTGNDVTLDCRGSRLDGNGRGGSAFW